MQPGVVVWADFGDGVGTEQSGRRPGVVVSSADHLAITANLAVVLPATTVDRGWPNHVRLTGSTGLTKHSYVMTEQARTISHERILKVVGAVDAACLSEIATWVDDWLISPTG